MLSMSFRICIPKPNYLDEGKRREVGLDFIRENVLEADAVEDGERAEFHG